ncbi:type I polyketide synthase [Chondromyces crocatus]|nr:type I polyketide synthase [Chondromyces crocatus]
MRRNDATLVELLRRRAISDADKTSYTFLLDGELPGPQLSYAELDRRARAIAARLQSVAAFGERALLLYPPGLDFIAAFFGCLYAGVVGVPAPPIDNARLRRTLPRIQAIARDAGAVIALSTSEIAATSARQCESTPELGHVRWIGTDAVPDELAMEWHEPAISADGLAYLQYTSGSTSTPKGVMVSHQHVLHQCELLRQGLGYGPESVALTWLPYFHDYGLVEGLIEPLYVGATCFVMSPLSFLKQPIRWLRAISRYRVTHSEGFNFAYEHCIHKITPERCQGLDLRCWQMAGNAAEPIRWETLERFTEALEPYGFRASAFYPTYGLAEATLVVSSGPWEPAQPAWFRMADLQRRRVVAGAGGGGDLRVVGCGRALCERVTIVNPETCRPCAPDEIGEIWVSDPCVAHGYWQRPEDTERTFRARIAGSDEGPFLRTGDLGFFRNELLHVTGRVKDVVILHGANHYPQDIEWTVEQCHEDIRPSCTAAFSVDVGGEERLAVIAEVRSQKSGEAVLTAIRQAIAEVHEISVHAITLIRVGSIPKTSSGKIQRSQCRADFLEGRLEASLSWEHPAARQREAEPALQTAIAHRELSIQAWLLGELATRLGVQQGAIQTGEPFARYGLSSHQGVALVGELESWLSTSLSPTLLWEYPTIEKLARHLAGRQVPSTRREEPAEPLGAVADEPMAIVGIGCRFPGDADTPSAFWKLLREGVDAIGVVPSDRWDADALYSADPAAPGKMHTRWGGFLREVRGFDAEFFGISPREAMSADPQQRLLLETAWAALEDAGIPPGRIAGASVGVFVGLSGHDYSERKARAGTLDHDIHAATGAAASIAANRISYALDLRGPSLAVDTACSSSLVAVHLACDSLRRGDCALALAGGVNLLLSPEVTLQFAKAGFMAPDGRCKAFDARANGYVRAEGVGVVALKPLSRALAEGDRIYALVRGSAVNQDGRSNGLTAPNQKAQEDLVRAACQRAGVAPGEVQYVEAHGTGTALGDPIEVKALGAVLAEGRAAGTPATIGSVKTNLGHTEAAAGIAGLIKVALSLHHEALPASLHFEQPNPHIPFETLPLRVQKKLASWPRGAQRRLAGVSSFGFGGTNAHVILEEAPEAPAQVDVPASGLALPTGETAEQLFLLSARSHEALRALAHAYVDRLDDDGALAHVPLLSLCAAAATRRSHHLHRIAITAYDRLSLRDKLLAFLHDEPRQGLSHAHQPHSRPARLVFVFPGQGAQWLGMGRQLFAHQPVFRDALRQCADAFAPFLDWSLEQALLHGDAALLERIDVLQPLLFAFQFALASLWRAWGLHPDALLGHSMGEVAAAAFSGALSLSDAARVICLRSTLLRSLHGAGAMAVVDLSDDDLRPILSDRFPLLDLAACNAPRSSVVAGEPLPLQQLIDALQAQGVYCRLVRVDVASHSRHVDPLLPRLLDALQGLQPRTASLPILSSVSAAYLDGAEMGPDYWARNLRQPVLFSQAVRRLLDDGPCRFLEIAPHPGLLHAIAQSFLALDAEPAAVASLRRDDSERAAMLDALGALYTLGHDLDVHALFPGTAPLPALPTYPFQHDPFWFQETPHAAPALRSVTTPHAQGQHHPLLGAHLASSVHRGTHFWHLDALSLGALPWLDHHRLHGHPVLPAAAFLDLALSAAASLGHGGAHIEQVAFRSAISLQESEPQSLQVSLGVDPLGVASFRVSSCPATSPEGEPSWTLKATGRLQLTTPEPLASPVPLPRSAIQARCSEVSTKEEHYQRLSERDMDYGPAFQGVAGVWRRDGEALGEIHVSASSSQGHGPHVVHPALLDACFQVLVAALPRPKEGRATGSAIVPVAVGALRRWDHAWTPVVWSHVVVRVGEPTSQGELSADLSIANAEGEPLLQVENFQARTSVEKRAREADPLHGMFCKVVWQQRPLARSATPSAHGIWLLLADRGGVAEQLRHVLRARGERCVLLRSASSTDAAGPQSDALLPTSAEGYKQLFANMKQEALACRGIVSLWPLDTATPEDLSLASLDASLQRSSTRVLDMIQGISRLDWPAAPRLWFVTGDAEATGVAVAASTLTQAPLWGLVRAMAYEHPELQPTCVDVPSSTALAVVEALADELLAGEGERQIRLREGARDVARLVRRPDFEDLGQDTSPEVRSAGDGGSALRLDIGTPGLLDTLTLRPVQRVLPGPGQVEIQVHAASLNFLDVLSAMGVRPDDPSGPIALGLECAGTVTAVGEGVSQQVGDAVLAVARGSLGTHVIADARLVVPRPDGLDVEQAATLPIAFMTAQYALTHLGRLERGERVLIHAAAGGVGLAAIQIARQAGAEVFATAGSVEKQAYLRSLGITQLSSSRSLQFASDVLTRTGGSGVDVVLNSLTGPAITAGLEVLSPHGRFLEIGKRDIYEDMPVGLAPFRRNLSYFAIDLARMLDERPAVCGRLLREIAGLVGEGSLRPLPYRTFPIAAAADAFRHMAQAEHIGKVVLTVDDEATRAADPCGARIREDGTYLVSGGLGALGLATADWLVQRGARHLVLVGRGDPSATAQEQIARFEQAGASVKTARVDVADEAALTGLLTELRTTMPPLRGVFHSAGVLDDGLLLQQTRERFEGVMRPKALGAWNLHVTTADAPLDVFVLYSSAAAILGSPGQANYCAANAFLHALARHRRAAGRPAHCIAWGPWGDVGLAAADERRGARLAARGLGSLTPTQGKQALGRVLDQGEAEVTVTPFNLRHWREFYPIAANSPLFAEISDAQPERPERDRAPLSGEELRRLAPDARRERLEAHVRDHLATVTRMPPARIQSDAPLMNLGLDSLMSLELRNRLEASLRITLPATLMFGHASLGSLAGHLAERMGLALSQSAGPSPEPPEVVSALEPEDLDALSVDEMASLLSAKLAALTLTTK